VLVSVCALGLLLSAGTAGGADPTLQIFESEEVGLLGEIKTAKCKVKRLSNGIRTFHAAGKTTNRAYKLDVDIRDFRGFDREYEIHYGDLRTVVGLEGAGADYSSVYPFPGTPPGSAGAIALNRRGSKMGLGMYALPNSDYSEGVALAGGTRCKYRRGAP